MDVNETNQELLLHECAYQEGAGIIMVHQEGHTYLEHRHAYSRGIPYQVNNRYNTISGGV